MFPNNDPAASMVAFYGCLLAEVVPVPIEVPLTRKVRSLPSPAGVRLGPGTFGCEPGVRRWLLCQRLFPAGCGPGSPGLICRWWRSAGPARRAGEGRSAARARPRASRAGSVSRRGPPAPPRLRPERPLKARRGRRLSGPAASPGAGRLTGSGRARPPAGIPALGPAPESRTHRTSAFESAGACVQHTHGAHTPLAWPRARRTSSSLESGCAVREEGSSANTEASAPGAGPAGAPGTEVLTGAAAAHCFYLATAVLLQPTGAPTPAPSPCVTEASGRRSPTPPSRLPELQMRARRRAHPGAPGAGARGLHTWAL